MFPGGHPSKYWLGSKLLNFSDRTRTGVFSLIWPLAFEKEECRVYQHSAFFLSSSRSETLENWAFSLVLEEHSCQKVNNYQWKVQNSVIFVFRLLTLHLNFIIWTSMRDDYLWIDKKSVSWGLEFLCSPFLVVRRAVNRKTTGKRGKSFAPDTFETFLDVLELSGNSDCNNKSCLSILSVCQSCLFPPISEPNCLPLSTQTFTRSGSYSGSGSVIRQYKSERSMPMFFPIEIRGREE